MTPLIRKDTKVLLVITKSNWGGAQAYVHTLATELAREGAEVVVALGGTGAAGAAPGALATRLKNAGIRTIVVTAFMRDLSLLHEWRAFIELLGIIRRERPQVVHVNSSKAGGIGTLAARLARIPRIIFTSHGLAYDEARAPLARALIACATWITFCLAHRVIVLSKDNERRGKRLPFCGKKVTLIYNGIEPVAYCSREEARRALTLPQEGLCVGTIAELVPNKALPSLIEAAALLVERRRVFTLYIIGDGDERRALEVLIRARHLEYTVRLTGFMPDAAQYLKAFDIFTLVSVKEGLPTVLLEAGGAGLAVVGSRIPGIVDIIKEERSGLLVEPQQSVALADALDRLMHDASLRATLGKELQRSVSRTFSRKKMLRETFACYDPPSYS